MPRTDLGGCNTTGAVGSARIAAIASAKPVVHA
jgi:hypothetical protein